jgi:hypothetical protein
MSSQFPAHPPYNFLYEQQTPKEDLVEIELQKLESSEGPPQSPPPPPPPPPVSEKVRDKINVMNMNNSWNDRNERLIVSIGENAAGYKWMHEKSAQMYNIISTVLGLSLVILNTGLSAQTLLPTSEGASRIVQDVIIYIVTLISVVKNFLKHEELVAKHLSTASKFAQLYHTVQQQMVLYRKDRSNAVEFIQTSLRTYDDLIVGGPEIGPIISQQFKRVFSNSQISLPDIADRIQRIEITTEVPSENGNGNGNVGSRGLSTRGLNLFCIENDITDEDLTQN